MFGKHMDRTHTLKEGVNASTLVSASLRLSLTPSLVIVLKVG